MITGMVTFNRDVRADELDALTAAWHAAESDQQRHIVLAGGGATFTEIIPSRPDSRVRALVKRARARAR